MEKKRPETDYSEFFRLSSVLDMSFEEAQETQKLLYGGGTRIRLTKTPRPPAKEKDENED